MAELDKVHLSKGDVVSRRYEIEEELGAGLLGVTYKARHITSGKFLAIKVLNPALVANPRDRARFEEGFQRSKELRHEGLVRYGDLGEHDGLIYFTQEYFPSQSLRQLLDEYTEEQKSFSFHEASQIILKVLKIVDFLHKNQMIHRNLKPENVLINTRAAGPGGKQIVRMVKFTDVGLAEVVNPTLFAESYVSRTEARYLAPELNGFDDKGQPSSDVFSIGVMYYELLVGQTPRGTYLSPSQMRGDIPEYVDNIVEMAIGAEAEDRYPSATDMITDIMRVFDGEVFDDVHKSNFRNILIGVGVAASIAGIVAVKYAADPPEDPIVEWTAQDKEIRDAAAGTIAVVTEAERTLHGEMVFIPAGDFVSGMLRQETGADGAGGVLPNPKTVPVPAFYIDRYEYPNEVPEAGNSAKKPTYDLEFSDVRKACQDMGKDLCTAEQWEKACRGPASTIYPYGDQYNEQTCGEPLDSDYKLTDFSECVSGYGVMGMSAGAREWTLTEGKTTTVEDDAGNVVSSEIFYVVKGGTKNDPVWSSRCAFQENRRASLPAQSGLSFRCCKAATPASL